MVVRRGQAYVLLQPNQMEAYLLGLCALSGALGLGAVLGVGALPDNGLPAWLNVPWFLLLAIGGTVGLAGLYWPDPVTGVLLTRAALLPIAAGGGMVAVGLATHRAWLAAGLTASFSLCAARRASKISHQAVVINRDGPP